MHMFMQNQTENNKNINKYFDKKKEKVQINCERMWRRIFFSRIKSLSNVRVEENPVYWLSIKHHYSTTTTSNNNNNTSPIPRICIVGSGPAGFYAAQHILKQLPNCRIDMLERLPVPFGLVR